MRAWTTVEAGERLLLLRSCCAADAEFASPQGVTRGLEAFSGSIGAFLRSFPRAEVVAGPPDAHNGYVRVRWHTRFNDGATNPIFGDDFIEFDGDMRIRRVVSFDGSAADA